ncbi:hypothetical protein Poli38472_004216 [Pythium oligandrum]|uniref:Uncharacterized protein n=1 Tax=Pythium oligandrum TaxID=41045 RepID=A0A8K1FKV1_PYTOL|nr:hypothetical protein Poli38472_004216 [Pythium oligandrum]|eukprot:TMW66451.1 hypothetical protein Poli38472_004216 [Pythium oligandrum]
MPTASTPQGEISFVPVDDEPLHKQRWKSDLVRLVDVQFPANTTCRWHQHVHYGVYISITPLNLTEQSIHDEKPRALCKHRGEVFCRDHTADRLTHVVSTEDPMRIIEVELLKDDGHVAHPELPVHEDRALVLLHEDTKCRVYRVTLMEQATTQVSIVLPTNAVLVALNDCTVSIFNPTVDDKIHSDHTRTVESGWKELLAGDDAMLVPGKFTLNAHAWDSSAIAGFILVEIY